MASFPSTLPKPLIEGYGGSQDTAFIRTEMEAGSKRQRQRFSAADDQLSMSWIFTFAEMTTFRAFFNTTINRGSDWFIMTLDVGDGMTTVDARFTSPYQYSRVQGDNWNVSANIEVRNA
jgi:hypothetical protein